MKRFKTWKRWVMLGGCVGAPTDSKRLPLQERAVIIRESDYRKIMAVYKAAAKVSNYVIISACMNDYEKEAIEALDKAVERAEK